MASGDQRLNLLETLFPRRALRLRQRAFASARRDVSQSDDDFLCGVCDECPTWQRQFVLELRARLAGCCTCETHSIRAGDSTAELHPVMGDLMRCPQRHAKTRRLRDPAGDPRRPL
jgi:hypothetical protein